MIRALRRMVFALLLIAPHGVAAAEITSTEDIVKALTPAPVLKRGLTLESSETAPRPRPSIDLNVEFEYDSANLTPTARFQLDALAGALRSDGLRGSRFEIAGHTDARGTPAYNEALSERRAQSVRDYLTTRHGINAALLAATGWGFTRLKNTADPFAAENRRVQISNSGQ